jgi:hypothetical protein
MPTKPYIDEAKLICDLLTPFFSIGVLKKANDETPPAGKNTLTKFRFKKRMVPSAIDILLDTAANDDRYIIP